jgi:hypothetical protein
MSLRPSRTAPAESPATPTSRDDALQHDHEIPIRQHTHGPPSPGGVGLILRDGLRTVGQFRRHALRVRRDGRGRVLRRRLLVHGQMRGRHFRYCGRVRRFARARFPGHGAVGKCRPLTRSVEGATVMSGAGPVLGRASPRGAWMPGGALHPL